MIFQMEKMPKLHMALIDSLLAPFVLIFIIFIGWLIENEIYTFALNVLFEVYDRHLFASF